MTRLKKFIKTHCKDFYVHIEPHGCEVFIEIQNRKTGCYHNMNVAINNEYEGLAMLINEWIHYEDFPEDNNTVH